MIKTAMILFYVYFTMINLYPNVLLYNHKII